MKREFAEEHQLRATVALLGAGDVTIQAVIPGFFRYHWRCGCEIVIDRARREWSTCVGHELVGGHGSQQLTA